MGAVEIYNRGRWGAVCIGGGDTAQFTIDAQVACRQLGFRFGVMFQVGESSRFPYDYIEYSFGQDDGIPSDFAWASEVVCTGTEERLDRCLFTEGSDNTLGGLPDEGVLDSCFRTLPVVCTQFELIGALTAVSFFAATMVCIRPYGSFGMHCGVLAMQCAVEEATHALLATWRFASSQRFLRCHVNTCWLVSEARITLQTFRLGNTFCYSCMERPYENSACKAAVQNPCWRARSLELFSQQACPFLHC